MAGNQPHHRCLEKEEEVIEERASWGESMCQKNLRAHTTLLLFLLLLPQCRAVPCVSALLSDYLSLFISFLFFLFFRCPPQLPNSSTVHSLHGGGCTWPLSTRTRSVTRRRALRLTLAAAVENPHPKQRAPATPQLFNEAHFLPTGFEASSSSYSSFCP